MKVLIVIFLLPFLLFAQDITGVWMGTLYNDTTRQFIKYEIAIGEYKGKLEGYLHTIFDIDSVENIGVKSVKIKKPGALFQVEDDKLVYNNYTAPPAKVVKTYCELAFSQNDNTMVLSGCWRTNRTNVYKVLTGHIFLQKKNKIQETLIIGKLKKLGLAHTLSFMKMSDATNDLAIINNPGFPARENNEQLVNVANDVVSHAGMTAGSEREQANTKSKVVAQNPGMVLSMTDPAKGKTEIISSQMPVSGATSLKTNRHAVESSATATTKSKPQKIDNPKKEDKEITKNLLKIDSVAAIKTIIESVPQPAAKIATRKIETIKSVEVNSDSLLLTLYENGEVDADTVSVLLNGKVIMPMQGLSTRAINKTIYLTPGLGDSVVLIMYAENLGSIPPNTGLLVVHDGNDIYEIRFSGDLQKNAAIILKRKRKK